MTNKNSYICSHVLMCGEKDCDHHRKHKVHKVYGKDCNLRKCEGDGGCPEGTCIEHKDFLKKVRSKSYKKLIKNMMIVHKIRKAMRCSYGDYRDDTKYTRLDLRVKDFKRIRNELAKLLNKLR